jgi:effector-binding domain-containing protein/uncharacterized protein YndB with AHSA1/START domain
MKGLKIFLFFLLAVVIATATLSFLLPTSQKVEKAITINAPAENVYEQLSKLEHFNKWSVWNQQDSTAIYILSGTDGTIGATTSWKGDPEISGEGKIEISLLEPNHKVVHQLHFTQPKKADAISTFKLVENKGITSVTWNFELATPRPWNIFNLFFSLDKQMGKDFETGLSVLKSVIEQTNGNASSTKYEVMTMDFPATTFASIRQKIKWTDIPAFYSQHLPIIYSEASKANAAPGTPAGLYYFWDEINQETDMAAALPVTSGTNMDNPIIQLVNIPASKALFVNYYGAYNKSMDAYSSIDKYLAENKLKQKTPVIEQYITDPANEKDTTKWLTKIVFLVE